ncbi:uncharacterized protein EI90DRAFT_3280215 [Cantharellus anzutake]|uniref:uncharacterized protein n=1 Tax=Cantharellus anzutake TaxID=1750568 RepID=UPI001905025B|nr:uncharacterized protein EI90DRAFT_3280215 [Cantharellus anzutake]KAF8333958.1 hypothetical protein EI90DRAFT_3280215 [Cantharellus anzutake]
MYVEMSLNPSHVTVGLNGGLTFTPETITAEVGDFVQLFFVSKNHTTTQSSFDSPCSPLIGSDGVTPTGFDSGLNPCHQAAHPLFWASKCSLQTLGGSTASKPVIVKRAWSSR